MATKTIAWNSGTGNITVTYTGSGDGTATITSSDNNLYEERSQQITFQTTAGSPQRTVTVTVAQAAKQKIDLSAAIVTAANQTYSGSALTPVPTVTLDGETVPSTGYDVTYSNNTNAGTATITITGKDDYVGTASGTFTIAKASRTISFTTAPTSVEIGYSITVVATPSAGASDGTITYTSSATSKASVSGNVVTGVAVGSSVISATISGGTNYADATTSYTLSVTEVNYANHYITFVALETGTFTFTNHGSGSNIQYSINGGSTWVSLASGTASPVVSAGSNILWKSTRTPGNANNNYGVGTFSSTGRFNVEGNAMSLLYGDDFVDKTFLSGKDGALGTLFEGCTNLVGASNMMLPAVRLVSYCYYGMFKDCTSLTTSPYIAPIISLGGSCCRYMFQGCTSLTTVPQLTATTTVGTCYANMFEGCTSLVTAPELPATTLRGSCYNSMFKGCTSLTTAPELPAMAVESSSYSNMFSGCTSLTEAPELPATTLAASCYQYMFQDCTGLTAAPSLPATSLENQCYYAMFQGCTSLVTVPTLSATTLAERCYRAMFSGCTSLTITPGLPATTLASYCYYGMFNGCISLTTVPELPATTLASYCYYGMFNGCISLTTAPELPATTLVEHCYQQMFVNCSLINYIKCLATDISATDCTTYWLSGVSRTGTFVKNADMESWTRGAHGIPTNWVAVNEHEDEYLTIVSKADNNTIGWKASDASILRTISISTDDGQTWVSKESSTTGTELATLDDGDKLLIKGSNNSYATADYYNYFTSTQIFDAQGNIMSLIYGDNFIGQTSIVGKNYALRYLFYQTSVVNAQNLKLPATTLERYCYHYMFDGCTSLTTAPELPATTLGIYCYSNMFQGCIALTAAPELPATALLVGCYNGMFRNCTALTTVPELSATTLVNYCYYNMFRGCTSLTTAPELPATALATGCYGYMFNGCTNLNYIKCLATDISASNCTYNWVNSVAANGTFVKNSAATWSVSGSSGIPSGWTVETASS